MAPPLSKPLAPRKRNRKRKRRVASSSSESSPDSDSSSSAGPSVAVAKAHAPSSPIVNATDNDSDVREEELSSSDDSSDSDVEVRDVEQPTQTVHSAEKDTQIRSPSPEPPLPGSIPIPSFLPNTGNAGEDSRIEQELKENFRKFWMTTIVDAFADDLNELRKVSTSHLLLAERATLIRSYFLSSLCRNKI